MVKLFIQRAKPYNKFVSTDIGCYCILSRFATYQYVGFQSSQCCFRATDANTAVIDLCFLLGYTELSELQTNIYFLIPKLIIASDNQREIFFRDSYTMHLISLKSE